MAQRQNYGGQYPHYVSGACKRDHHVVPAPVIIAPAEIWKMERQASTLNTPANKSHSMMNGHCESGKKRPRMDEEGSVKKKKKGEFLKGSIVRIRLHNFL